MNTRKGISPLIATLLLIAIAVAASVLTYSWVMSMVGTQSAQAQTQIRIDTVTWLNAGAGAHDSYKILIRNTGSVAATVESISIRKNEAGSSAFTYSMTTSNSLDVGKTLEPTVTLASPIATWAVSTSYVIRVTSSTGFYYEMVATTPAA